MPAAETITLAAAGVLFIGSVVVQCGKFIVDSLTSCCSVERNVAYRIQMSPSSLIDLGSSVIVDHVLFDGELSRRFEFGHRCGGVSVLGCPAGSGKSTYVCKYIPLLCKRKKCQYIFLKVDCKFLLSYGLHEYLGIPQTEQISKYIPKGTVIVFDQCDLKLHHLQPGMEDYIVSIATDSRNTKLFQVIICISNSDVFAKMVMNYNNGEKICQLCLPSTMKWTPDFIKTYINKSLPHWSSNDREKLVTLFANVQSPGPVWNALQSIEIGDLRRFDDLGDGIRSQIQIAVTTLKKSWQGFDEVEKKLLGEVVKLDPS